MSPSEQWLIRIEETRTKFKQARAIFQRIIELIDELNDTCDEALRLSQDGPNMEALGNAMKLTATIARIHELMMSAIDSIDMTDNEIVTNDMTDNEIVTNDEESQDDSDMKVVVTFNNKNKEGSLLN